jgi:hypothetical protein
LYLGGWERASLARGAQFAQENPLEQLEGVEQATSGEPEVLAKAESWRSTFSLSHLGHFTPSGPAPIFCRRENPFPQSVHLYS